MPCLAKPPSPKCPGPPEPEKTGVKITIQLSPAELCAYCRLVIDHKINIRARRNSIDQLSLNTGGLQLLQEWKVRADQIVTDLFQQEIAAAGAVPCSYAFCLAGSGARGEACPYSDLDCFILIATDSPTAKQYFRAVSTKVKDMLLAMDEMAGLRFCFGGLNPLGQPNAPERPELILVPVQMAGLIENPKIDKHVRGSIGEYRMLCGGDGSDKVMEDYKAEVNLVLAKTCFTFSSRPNLTKQRKEGLDSLREAYKLKVPEKTAATWDIKMDFYRLPQLAVKGLRLYYGVDTTNTATAVTLLQQRGKLSAYMAKNLLALMEVLTGIRTKAQLHTGQELDEVYTAQPSTAKKNYVLGAAELDTLQKHLFFMHRLHDRVDQFISAKEQMFGPRGNPFATD